MMNLSGMAVQYSQLWWREYNLPFMWAGVQSIGAGVPSLIYWDESIILLQQKTINEVCEVHTEPVDGQPVKILELLVRIFCGTDSTWDWLN